MDSGHASPDHKGCSITSLAVHVEGTVRALGYLDHDNVWTLIAMMK